MLNEIGSLYKYDGNAGLQITDEIILLGELFGASNKGKDYEVGDPRKEQVENIINKTIVVKKKKPKKIVFD